MTDDKLADELAQHLANRDGRRSLFTDDLDATERAYRDEYLRTAQVALEWLAERGRLVPEGAETAEEWAAEVTFHHGDVEYWREPTRGLAEAHVSRHSDLRRLVYRTVITAPWVPVPEEAT